MRIILAAIICLFVDDDIPIQQPAPPPMWIEMPEGNNVHEAFRFKARYIKVEGSMIYLITPENFERIAKLYPKCETGETTIECFVPNYTPLGSSREK